MPQDITSMFNQANQAQQGVVNSMQSNTKLPDMLRQAVSERFSKTGLTEARSAAAGNLLNTPSSTRSEMANLGQTGQVILSPSQQQSILAGQRTSALTPLMTLNDMMTQRSGTTEQAINAGLSAYNTDIKSQQLNADSLYKQAESAYDRYMREREFGLAQQKAGSGTNFLSSLLSGLSGGQPTEAKPMYSANQVGATSKGGEWTFNGKDWDPIQQSGGGLESLITPEVLMSGVLSGDLSSADANTLGKLAGLGQYKTSAEKNRETMIGEKEYNLNLLDNAIKLLTEGKVKTGPLSGNILQAKAKSGIGINQNERDIYNLIAKIGAKQLFALGGKTLPSQEMARLEPFTTSYTLPTEQNLTALQAMRKELEAIYGSMIDNQSGYELIEY